MSLSSSSSTPPPATPAATTSTTKPFGHLVPPPPRPVGLSSFLCLSSTTTTNNNKKIPFLGGSNQPASSFLSAPSPQKQQSPPLQPTSSPSLSSLSSSSASAFHTTNPLLASSYHIQQRSVAMRPSDQRSDVLSFTTATPTTMSSFSPAFSHPSMNPTTTTTITTQENDDQFSRCKTLIKRSFARGISSVPVGSSFLDIHQFVGDACTYVLFFFCTVLYSIFFSKLKKTKSSLRGKQFVFTKDCSTGTCMRYIF